MTRKAKVLNLLHRLYNIYPQPKTELIHSNAFELLIAVMLSAQTTDKTVNSVTQELFKRYPTPKKLAEAKEEEIYSLIRKVNYSQTKARHLKQTSQLLIERYNGNVPQTMDDLTILPGVGRKTANVVLGDAFHKPVGIVVDTHVMRLSRLLGLTNKKTPETIEKDLMNLVPKEQWQDFSHLLILYGRYQCPARKNPKTCPDIADLISE